MATIKEKGRPGRPCKPERPLTPRRWALVMKYERMMWKWAYQWTPPSLRFDEGSVTESFDVLFHKAIKATRTFRKKHGRTFGTYFGAKAFHSVRDYWRRKIVMISIDEEHSNSAGLRLLDMIPDEKTMPRRDTEESPAVERALRFLDDRDRIVIELWYGLNDNPKLTSKEIGVILGVTGERIRQLHKRAKDRIIQRFLAEAPHD